MRPPTKGPVNRERVWCFVEALLTRAEARSEFKIHWEKENTDRPEFVVDTKLRFLTNLAELKNTEMTAVIKLLEELGIWDDRRLNQNRGSERGKFALKLWSVADLDRNKKKFDKLWDEKRTYQSKKLEEIFTKKSPVIEAAKNEIEWRKCCHKMIPTQLSINPLLSGDGVILTIEDMIPLELAERRQRPQQKQDFSPENFTIKVSNEEEVTVTHQQFFDEILNNRNSTKSHGKRIAIIGEPGAGKSTFIQEIAHWIYKNGELPVFVNLADLAGKNIEQYLLEDWLKYATQMRRISDDIKDEFIKFFDTDRVWLLLDGVDEISATGNLIYTLDKQLKGWVAKARIVLTCRLNIWDAKKNVLDGIFDIYRTKAFIYNDMVRKFIGSFFIKAGDQIAGEELIQKLDSSSQRIKDLIKNPLRLTLLCRTWKRRQGNLPQTKAELYKQFVNTFYDWRDKPNISITQRQILEQGLGELAKKALDKKTKYRLSENFIREELEKVANSLFDLACQVGWINKWGMETGNSEETVYAFFHPTFQEYFAALQVNDWDFFLPRQHKYRPVEDKDSREEYKRYRIFEPQWREVILLWLGREEVSKREKEAFLKSLVEFDDGCKGFYGLQAYFLAAVGIAEVEISDLADKIIKQLIEWTFGSENFFKHHFNLSSLITKIAKDLLLQTHSQKVVDGLIQRLKSSESQGDSLETALILLEKSPGHEMAVNIIVDYLNNSEHISKQSRAININRILVINKLEKFAASNTLAIDILANLNVNKQSHQKTISKYDFSWLLPKGNSNDIGKLIDLAGRIDNIEKAISKLNDFRTLVGLLGRNIQLNTKVEELAIIDEMIDIANRIDDSKSDFISGYFNIINSFASNRLAEITFHNSNIITNLIETLYQNNDQYIRQQLMISLGQAACINIDATKAILQLWQTTEDEIIAEAAIYFLKKVSNSNLLTLIVIELKDYIEDTEGYEIIWHCAQNMPYPDFYQAWHQGNGEKVVINHLDLPQRLQAAIKNDPQLSQNIQLIYIDTSQFIEPDNPAAEIYAEMVSQGCPERTSGEPNNMSALKVYFKLLKTDKRVVLLFHPGATNTTGEATYSNAFLNAISKFEGTICFISDPIPNYNTLKVFTRHQSVNEILEWLRSS